MYCVLNLKMASSVLFHKVIVFTNAGFKDHEAGLISKIAPLHFLWVSPSDPFSPPLFFSLCYPAMKLLIWLATTLKVSVKVLVEKYRQYFLQKYWYWYWQYFQRIVLASLLAILFASIVNNPDPESSKS